MKSTINGVKLTIESKKNRLPVGNGIFGFLKLKHDLTTASFKEEWPSAVFEKKTIRLKQGPGYSVRFNPEKNLYRICISIDADNPAWMTVVENFGNCMNFVEKRIDN
ncbi:MAG: hypothetical protein IK144_05565 [Bacteroidaceae bacterium]|nr:hypothetical protein [Bacteroidaceae bacterium]